jgi:hypothetical protein
MWFTRLKPFSCASTISLFTVRKKDARILSFDQSRITTWYLSPNGGASHESPKKEVIANESARDLFSLKLANHEPVRDLFRLKVANHEPVRDLCRLKVHKIENFFGSELEFCTISLLVLLKY